MPEQSSEAPTTLLERLRRIDSTSLADADKSLRILPLAIRPIATGRRLLGRAVTADANGDLMSVIAALQHAGAGDVLVVSAGSDEHAVAGELFATEAHPAWTGGHRDRRPVPGQPDPRRDRPSRCTPGAWRRAPFRPDPSRSSRSR